MVTYSHSRLATFEQCPFKFKLRYIDKVIPEIKSTIEAYLGSVVHGSLEWIYTEVGKGRLPTIDDIIVHYAENWQRGFNSEIKIVRKNMTVKDYFDKGVNFLLDYCVKYTPFDDNTLEVEKKIVIELDEENKLQGFIDRLVYNSETEEYEVHDYKTAANLPTKEKVESDRQLALYSIAIKEKFGFDKDVVLIWHYLAHNTKLVSRRTNEQLKQLKKETITLIKQIEVTTDFPPIESALCGWCEYKNMCFNFRKNGDGKNQILNC